jgi:ABC-type multidrug transport system fused ATPase/permease subunit
MQETIHSLRGKATVVIIAHRLSPLSVCDRMMVLVDGQIRDFAPPEFLSADSNYYREVSSVVRA